MLIHKKVSITKSETLPERAEAVPSADVFKRIAKALEVAPDFLLNGTIQDNAKNYIQDSELLLQFEKIEKLPQAKKELVKEFLDAFIQNLIYNNNLLNKHK